MSFLCSTVLPLVAYQLVGYQLSIRVDRMWCIGVWPLYGPAVRRRSLSSIALSWCLYANINHAGTETPVVTTHPGDPFPLCSGRSVQPRRSAICHILIARLLLELK
jgi:hypothetical protein